MKQVCLVVFKQPKIEDKVSVINVEPSKYKDVHKIINISRLVYVIMQTSIIHWLVGQELN